MYIKDVLFHLECNDSSRSVIDFATSFALATRAHLTAAGVVIEYPPPTAGPSMGMAGFNSLATFERLTEESRKALELAYQEFAGNAPAEVETELAVIQGYRGIACHDFGRLARYFDLSIVGQGAPGEEQIDKLVVSAALFGSGRPVFVVPFIHKGPARLE